MIEHNSKTYFLAGLLAAAGLAILIYLGLTGASLEVYSVQELLAAENGIAQDSEGKKMIQIYGRAAEPDDTSEDNIILVRDWDDPSQAIRIRHTGQTPPGLKPGQDLFITGTYSPHSGDFTAKEIITTCPAKYEARRPKE